jgi:UDP-N-acetylglucosamine/UDP-N-acetylgalactosamine diphosphorylase
VRAGARVVAKAYSEERVGVFARRDGRIEVVEYSELDPQEAAAMQTGAHQPLISLLLFTAA